MSQQSSDTVLNNINLKLIVRSINRKSKFQLIFLPYHSTTRQTINVSTIAIVHYFSLWTSSEASVIDSNYIKMSGRQDFY